MTRAGGILLIALIKEGEYEGYSLPKGHLEPGETIEQAAQREVVEETGLHDLVLLGRIGTRERLNFARRVWNVTHYCAFRASAAEGGPVGWFPLDDLPVMFWPEQRELIETHRRDLEALSAKRAVQTQFTKRAGAYARSPSHARDEDLALLLHHLQPRASDRVLDVATGTGFIALALLDVAGRVVGLDVTRGMLEEARKLAGGRGSVYWVEGDAEALPFRAGSFAIVVVRRAPHHLPSVVRAVQEMLRVTARGGRIGIADQVPPEDAAGRALMETIEILRDPSHVRSLRASEWRRLVSASGAAVEFVQVVERAMLFEQWLDLAGADRARAEKIEAALARATPAARAQIGDVGIQPRTFLKRWIVLVALKP